jgi:MFS transporter, DHA1 family, staphyloferrin A biosynthesis exporter
MKPSAATAERSSGAFASLRHPQYRWLWTSNLFFFLAMMGQSSVVRPWLVLELTDNHVAFGATAFAVALPMLILAPLGGVIGDRYERRGLIMFGQAAIVASELVLLGLLWFDRLRFWHLLVGTFGMGMMFPFIMPARQAIVASIVGRDGLSNAMALSMAGMNACRVVGPFVSASLISTLGIKWAYTLGVLGYLLGWVFLLPVDRTHVAASARAVSIARGIQEGASYLVGHRLVLALLVFGLLPMLLAMPFQTLLAVFAHDVWDAGASGLGWLQAATGLGGIAGSLYVARTAQRHDRLRRMLASVIAFGLLLLTFSQSPTLWLGLPLVFFSGAFSNVFQTLNNSAIQMLIPDEVRSRVSSFLMMSFSLPLLGTLPLSALSELQGPRRAIATASCLAILVSVAFYALVRPLRRLDAEMERASNGVPVMVPRVLPTP